MRYEKVRIVLLRLWETAREILGDRAYDRYARQARARGAEPLSAEEFYVSQLQRKYSRPSRCC